MPATPQRRSKREGVVISYAGGEPSPPKSARKASKSPARRASGKPVTSSPLEITRKETVRRLEFAETDGKENVFEFEEFEDEIEELAKSAVDHYFLGGKALRTNRARGGRRKGNKRGENNVNVERDDESEMEKQREETLAKYEQLDMGELKAYLEQSALSDDLLPPAIQKRNEQIVEEDFPRWKAYLCLGFNLLVHGVGSKRKLLQEFRERELKEQYALLVDGFLPEISIRSILTVMDEKMKLNCPVKRRSLSEWARDIARAVNKTKIDVILLVNNLDGPNLRDPSEIAAMATLAEAEHIHLVCSVDHVNASLMFNTRVLASFNFLYCRASTMRVPTAELLAGESSLLGLNSKSSSVSHSLASLDVIWASFPANSRKIFRLFFAMFFSTNTSVSFWDLFAEARDRFLVSTDVALRQQLVEFEDHRIVKTRRSEDGTEKLSAAVDKELVEKFLVEKGLSLDMEDDD